MRVLSRSLAGITSGALAATTLTLAPPAAVAVDPDISLAKSAPDTVLAGEELTYSLTISNPVGGTQTLYNASASDILPTGMTYVAGSAAPFRDPVIATGPGGQQTLVWTDLEDIADGDTLTVTFTVTGGTDVVGDTLANSAVALGSTDPRQVPDFGPDGSPQPGDTDKLSAPAVATTQVTAIEVEKSEPSPEGELLRGVHDQTTVYTLTVRNNEQAATDDATVVDYIPAVLEFLGCGEEDNSSGLEYPGAPGLGGGQAPADCLTPQSVETVENPPGRPAGIYTRVTWQLGDLPANSTREIQYVAGIPLKANELFSGTAPTPESLEQASNLDNNTGDSTREQAAGVELGLTNTAVVTGTYTGPHTEGTGNRAVTDEDSLTVTAEDVRLVKSVAPPQFSSGGVATFTLKVDVSEYVNASAIRATDTLPDGYCPLGGSQNYAPGSPPDCAPGGGAPPSGAAYGSVAFNSDGSYTIAFSALDVDANGSTTITFQARMRAVYSGAGRPGAATSAGDEFENRAGLTARTTAVNGTGQTPQVINGITDDSSATQGTAAPTIDKTMKPRHEQVDCDPAIDPRYQEPGTGPDWIFRSGDTVCFRLRVDFPSTISTRNPVVSDFVPVGTELLPNSWQVTGPPDGNTVEGVQLLVPTDPTAPVWTMGTDGTGGRFAAPGAVFEITFAAVVTAPAPPPLPDLTGNLMKLQWENTAGTKESIRDQVEFAIAPAPAVDLLKGVYQVNTPASGPNNPNTDGSTVQQTSRVTYRVDVANTGTPSNDPAARAVQAWDVLPVGVPCSAISNYRWVAPRTDAVVTALPGTIPATCTDPTATNLVDPAYGDTTKQALIRWTATDVTETTIPAGQTMTLLYDMVTPTVISVSARLDNVAAVRSFTSETNLGGRADFYPLNNIDASVTDAQQNAQSADDPSHVVTRAATVAKTGTTSITETNNNTPTEATIGERVTYTYSVVLPAQTSVFTGTLTDALPTGYALQATPAPTLTFFPGASSTTPGRVPGGVTLDPTTGAVSFGSTYTNATASDQRFQVTATVVVTGATAGPAENAVKRTNTATFSSQTAPTGGAGLPPVNAAYDTFVVQPSPTLAKSANPTTVIGGQTVTYRLTAGNAAGRPPLHDSVVVDCLPVALTYQSATVPGGTTVVTAPGDGSNGCTSAFTRILWTIGTIEPGATQVLTYTARMEDNPPAGSQFVNRASVTGSSIAGANPDERTYTAQAQATVRVQGASLTKTVTPGPATIGEMVTYTLSETIPKDVVFYDAAVVDLLPTGITAVSPPLTTTSATCFYQGTTDPCTGLEPGFGSPLTASGQRVAWRIGDINAETRARTVTITYSTPVADIGTNTAGVSLQNTAQARWNLVDGATLTDANSALSLTNGSNRPTANVVVIEPSMSVSKTVSNSTPSVEDTFSYTVTATNGSGTNVSAAHQVTIVDTVPVGVVVGTISDGGTLSGAGSNGGGTITWVVPGPIALGSSVARTYFAQLANSSTLTNAALTNTVDIPSYFSLPGGAGREYDNVTPATAQVTPAFPRFTPTKAAAGSTTALIGEPFAWRLQVRNTGNAAGYDVDVTDVLPVNWTYDANSARVSVAGATATATEPTTVSPDRRTLTWTDLGDIAAGQSIIITLTATPQPGVTTTPGVGSSIPHVNTVSTLGRDGDGNTANASGTYSQGPASANAFIAAADLQVTKTPDGGSVTAGVPFDWTIAVRNNGPDTSVAPITVTDTLPAGLEFISAAGSGWSCPAPTGATLTCTRGTNLATNATSTITVRMRPPAGVANGTGFDNGATVVGTTLDPVPGNNTDTGWVTTTTAADLRIVKERATATVVAGGEVDWTLAVTNLGPSVSRSQITVTDVMPTGLTYVEATGTDWTCTFAPVTKTMECTYGKDLAVNERAPVITLTTQLAADIAPGTIITNTGTVTGTTPDPNPGNNTDDATGTVTASADLYILKSHLGDDPWNAGESVPFVLDLGNKGPSDAVNVVVSDTFDSRLILAPSRVVAPAGWTCGVTGQVLTCTVPRLAAGATAQVTITVTIRSDVPNESQIPNEATITSTTPDPIDSNNKDADNIDTRVLVDLAIVKTHDKAADPRSAGTDVTFDLKVSNNGPSNEVAPITVTDAVPAGMAYVNATGSDPAWTCPTGPLAGGVVTCTLGQGLAANATAPPLKLTFRIDPAVSEVPITLVNIAEVSGPSPDGDSSNNASTDRVPVVNLTNLTVAKRTVPPNPVQAGTNATFEVDVINQGPSSAYRVQLVDTLPAGTSFVSAAGTGWTCAASGQDITCSRDRLDPGTSSITIVAKVSASVPDATRLTNTAEVSTQTAETNTNDNTASSTVDVVAEVDMVLTKTHDGDAVAGESLTFTMIATNNGPSDAQPTFTIVDTLPAGFTYVSDGPGWTCVPEVPTPTGQEVTCTSASTQPLVPGASLAPLEMVVQVSESVAAGRYTNVATVSSGTKEINEDNNTARDTVVVGVIADLAIVKSHTGTALIGEELDFTLAVTNLGPSTAEGVSVTDPLPTGLTYVSATGDGWACSTAGQDVTCTRADPLPVGDAPAITLTVEVSQPAYPSVTNVATVTSQTPDPDLTNNASRDPVTVDPNVDLAIVKSHSGNAVIGTELPFTLTVTVNEVEVDGEVVTTSDPGPITVVDTLPTGLIYISAASTGWACSAVGQVITCVKADGLALGASSTITLTTLVQASAYPGVTNPATVGSPAKDIDLTNNSTQDPVTVDPQVDLYVVKSHTGTGTVGGAVTFTLLVGNKGPTVDPGPVVVTDTLPVGLTYAAASGPGWTCTASGQVVTCTDPDGLAAGEASTISLTVNVELGAFPIAINVATVTGAGPDVDLSNNTSKDPLGILPVFDLGIDKSLESVDGDRATWLITVDNAGPHAAPGPFTVIDELPDELEYLSSSGSGWSCVERSGTVTCTFSGTIPAGGTSELRIVTRVNAEPGEEVTNTASLGPEVGGATDNAVVSVDQDGGLADTGAGTGTLEALLAALMLLAAGAGAVTASRRRRST